MIDRPDSNGDTLPSPESDAFVGTEKKKVSLSDGLLA